MELIKTKKIHLLFSNKNDEMNLKPHAHHATVTFEFETLGSFGFPAFKETVNEIRHTVLSYKLKGFQGTNEKVIRHIHNSMRYAELNECTKYNGRFRLFRTTLDIFGVNDEINHDEGETTYIIQEREYTEKQFKKIAELNNNLKDNVIGYADYQLQLIGKV